MSREKDIGARSWEQFFHDIPFYPGVNTPDGRIVGELSRLRRQGESQAEYQGRILEELRRANSGRTEIPVSQLIDSQDAPS
jgi:hypothetical protein